MKPWLYAFACVLVPIAWGLIVVWVTNRLENRLFRQTNRTGAENESASPPPIDFHI